MVETSTPAGTGEDLYDWLGLLRDGAPVRRIQGANGLEYWLVTRHSEAASVLARPAPRGGSTQADGHAGVHR
jgi:hypothetical protein